MTGDASTRALLVEAKQESLALQFICTALLCEVAMLHQNPRSALDVMTARLRGLGEGVAAGSQDNTHSISRVIERVTSQAEAALEGPSRP